MVDARIQKSRQALMAAGLKLMNKNKETSLSEVAKAAGVGRATLYRLYATKEALVEEIALHCLSAFDAVTQPIEKQARSSLHAFELLFQLAMPLTEELQFLISLDHFSETIPEVRRINAKQEKELIALIEFGKKAGEIDKHLATTWILNIIESLFYAGWAQQKKYNSSSDEVAALAYLGFSKIVRPVR